MEISPVLTAARNSAERKRNNLRLAVKLSFVALFFVGFGFAMVPIYDVFCAVTGLNGRTNKTAILPPKNTQVDMSRSVKVEFLSHSMPGVALTFKPELFSIRIHPGEISQMNYTITNTTDKVFVGQAIPSVTPAVAAQYFEKLECFCFSQQTFQPGETRTMPVVFVVNPELGRDYGTVTLSYTFFEAIPSKS
ncbi:MAG: cytochrome c oxidase assembly protein [Comamonadaceae bacterium CG_4_9_14_3_um_filter_60_33]|nr:MAG: cytochrome c oxidase assembly protein [Comamonadaceae bacterium CG2_30_59_20]PIY29725.1 MAG: cytochrome c oxidase assembly protein [Comamonadaceae bacterium CG_4_10_14_3_um_filter_60_42]PJB43516.1 MAG: cytochrome c oxidase assembly protein [Comamonadaceae bacterium CG_4_9_14_3_um_filter_60_33]